MTTNQPRTMMDSLSGFVRLCVVVWLGWIALVLFYGLWTELPVVAVALTAGALALLWWRHRRRKRWIMAQHVAYNNAKAERHRRDRVERALRNPQGVFEANKDEWEREFSE